MGWLVVKLKWEQFLSLDKNYINIKLIYVGDDKSVWYYDNLRGVLEGILYQEIIDFVKVDYKFINTFEDESALVSINIKKIELDVLTMTYKSMMNLLSPQQRFLIKIDADVKNDDYFHIIEIVNTTTGLVTQKNFKMYVNVKFAFSFREISRIWELISDLLIYDKNHILKEYGIKITQIEYEKLLEIEKLWKERQNG